MPNENALAGRTNAKRSDKKLGWLYQLQEQNDSTGARTYRWWALSADARLVLSFSSLSNKSDAD
jgi:hypothetical protein